MPITRDLLTSDAAALAAVLQRNQEHLRPWEPLRPPEYFTVAGQEKVIADQLRMRAARLMLPRVILDETGQVVGRVNLNNIVLGAFRSASVGYWLDEAAGGRGLATLAVAEVVAVAFGDLGLHRVEAGTLPHNTRSQQVLLRNGFTRFGYAPAYLAIEGTYQDHVLYQLLADPS